MGSLEHRIANEGKARVVESTKVRLRHYKDRKIALMKQIQYAKDRIVEVEAEIDILVNDLKQLEDECTSKS